MSHELERALGYLAIATGLAASILFFAPWLGEVSGKFDRLAALFPATIPLILLTFLLGYRAQLWGSTLFLAVALCCVAAVMGPEVFRRAVQDAPGEPQLTIVTHNLKVFNFDPRQTASELIDSRADIILLQEWGPKMETMRPLLKARFPFSARCGMGELQIMSRLPIAHSRCAETAIGPAGQILLLSEIPLVGGPTVTVLTLHPTWKLPRFWRAEARKALVHWMRQRDPAFMVVAGDFNLTPWNEGMRDLDRGLAPLQRVTQALFSFPARARGFSWPIALLPIDHVFVGPGLNVLSVERLPRTGSDHYPIRVKLRWTQRAGTAQRPAIEQTGATEPNSPALPLRGCNHWSSND